MSEVQRNYKDTVFRMLFKEPENLLALYNAVNKTNYTNVEDLQITTLENAVWMNVKNDVSCVFDFELSLYEHQSTVNPNIPLRNLIYVSNQLDAMFKPEELYGRKKKMIPTPRFVVFYNGKETVPERSEYRLSDLFEKTVDNPELELIVTVYNINQGMNVELLESCRMLKEYMLFVTEVRENRKKMEHKEAVEKAVNDCIARDILKNFLLKNKAEAISMSIFEYNEEEHMEIVRREGYEEGREEGITAFIKDKLEDEVPADRIVVKLMKHYHLKEEEAREWIDKCRD